MIPPPRRYEEGCLLARAFTSAAAGTRPRAPSAFLAVKQLGTQLMRAPAFLAAWNQGYASPATDSERPPMCGYRMPSYTMMQHLSAHPAKAGPLDLLHQPQSFRHPEVWLLTVLLPVFSCLPGLFLPGGLCGAPGVPGSAPAPTVPGWYSFRVAGTVRAGQVGAGSVQSRFQQARNSLARASRR